MSRPPILRSYVLLPLMFVLGAALSFGLRTVYSAHASQSRAVTSLSVYKSAAMATVEPADFLPGQKAMHNWEKQQKIEARTQDKAKPFAQRAERQFEGVQSIRITAQRYYHSEDGPASPTTAVRATYIITLKPFRIHEVEEGLNKSFTRTRITTELMQTVRIQDAEGENTQTKLMLNPDPFYHGGLPGLEDLFYWDWYGAGLEREGELLSVPLGNLAEPRWVDVPALEIATMIGKSIVCDWPETDSAEFHGRLLVKEHIAFRLISGFRSDRVVSWQTFPDLGIVLPRTVETFACPAPDSPWQRVCTTSFVEVVFNEPVDEALFQ